MASELTSYQSLALAAAKYLADQLGERMQVAPTFAGLEAARQSLAEGDAMLRFANIGMPSPIAILATPADVVATTLDTEAFLAEVEASFAEQLAALDRRNRSGEDLAAARRGGRRRPHRPFEWKVRSCGGPVSVAAGSAGAAPPRPPGP